MVSKHLKCNMRKAWVLYFSRPLLITFLITLSLEIFKELLFLKKVWTIKVGHHSLYLVPILMSLSVTKIVVAVTISTLAGTIYNNIIQSCIPILSSLSCLFIRVHSYTDRMFCVIADYGRTMCGHCSSLSKIQIKKILYVFTFDWCMYSIQPGFKDINCYCSGGVFEMFSENICMIGIRQ